MRPIFLLIALALLSSLGCSGAGTGVAPEELTPLQRWVATRTDEMGLRTGFVIVIDAQAGIARLFHDGVITQELPIKSVNSDETVAVHTTPAE